MKEIKHKYEVKPKLKKILIEKGFSSQKEFAKMADLPEPTVSRFDSQSRYDINTLATISRTLGVKIDDLFEITEQQ